MLVVVRCPACRGASRVEEPALGLAVLCPRCEETFTAVEEAEFLAPAPPRPRAEPARPATELRPRPEPEAPPLPTWSEPDLEEPGPDDDAHPESQAGLPATVLIGLALLPFVIPILWLVGPALFGESPVLSLATPIALAVAASVLCLAVIGTVDWTPATRVKGVLMLVGLSYVVGASLYFLKKEMVDQVKKFFGTEHDWVEFKPPGAGFQVRLPRGHQPLPNHQPLGLAALNCQTAQHRDGLGQVYTVVVGAGKPVRNAQDPAPGSDDWFEQAAQDIADRAGGRLQSSEPVTQQDAFPGRELEIRLGEGGAVRVVRVFVVRDRVFYLSVEGPGMHAGDDLATELFNSFLVPEAQ
jgi:hypothetical protein